MTLFDDLTHIAYLSLRSLWHPVAFGVRAFVEDSAGRVVLVRHSYRAGWFLPGGGVDRHEAPEAAATREAREEAGMIKGTDAEFFGLYTQPVAWVTNVVSVYWIREAEIDFRKSFEIRELVWADPLSPPEGTTGGTLRRLAEFSGKAAKSSRW